MILDVNKSADLDWMRVLQGVQLKGDDKHVAAELLPHLELGVDPIVIILSGLWIRNDMFRIRLLIRFLRKFRLRLRIRQKVSDPTGSGSDSGSGSTTLVLFSSSFLYSLSGLRIFLQRVVIFFIYKYNK
jgi:hypothetical protein